MFSYLARTWLKFRKVYYTSHKKIFTVYIILLIYIYNVRVRLKNIISQVNVFENDFMYITKFPCIFCNHIYPQAKNSIYKSPSWILPVSIESVQMEISDSGGGGTCCCISDVTPGTCRCLISASFCCVISKWCLRHFIRRFWNQTLTCLNYSFI